MVDYQHAFLGRCQPDSYPWHSTCLTAPSVEGWSARQVLLRTTYLVFVLCATVAFTNLAMVYCSSLSYRPVSRNLILEAERKPTCAIVLNSGVMTSGRAYGVSIDNHEVIVRFNNAPTKGYERFVGTRTTFMWTWHAHYPKFLEQMNTQEYKDTKLIIGPFQWDADLLRKSGIPASRYVIPNITDLGEKCKAQWLTPDVVTEFPHKRCTSGVSATIYFLERCASVDVYGLFDGNLCDIPYRYFSSRKCNASDTVKIDPSHNFTHEHALFRKYSAIDPRLTVHPPPNSSSIHVDNDV